MRSFVIAASIFGVAFSCACIVEFPSEEASEPNPVVLTTESKDDWRRTVDGWERSATWRKPHECNFPLPANVARIHPIVIAALQMLLSFGGLLAFSDVTRKHSKTVDLNKTPSTGATSS